MNCKGISPHEMATEWGDIRAIEDGFELAGLLTIVSTNPYPFVLITEQLIKIIDLSLE